MPITMRSAAPLPPRPIRLHLRRAHVPRIAFGRVAAGAVVGASAAAAAAGPVVIIRAGAAAGSGIVADRGPDDPVADGGIALRPRRSGGESDESGGDGHRSGPKFRRSHDRFPRGGPKRPAIRGYPIFGLAEGIPRSAPKRSGLGRSARRPDRAQGGLDGATAAAQPVAGGEAHLRRLSPRSDVARDLPSGSVRDGAGLAPAQVLNGSIRPWKRRSRSQARICSIAFDASGPATRIW